MSRFGKDVHQTEAGDRIFVGPNVDRYEREDGGEVIVVEKDGDDADDSPQESLDE